MMTRPQLRGCSSTPAPRLRTVMVWGTEDPSGVEGQSLGWVSGLGMKSPETEAFLLILNIFSNPVI